MSLKFNPRWDLLENVTVIGERLAVRLALPDIRKDIFIAVDVSRRRHVLVTIPYGEPCELDERVSVGIAVRTVEMKTSDGQLCSFIEIACLDPQGYPALDVVINEIAEALQSGASIGCVRVVQNVLAKWRRFWSGVKTDVLSREQQIGLFGELWFLQYWLVPSVGLSRSIDMWRGPLGARNDFESQGVGIEIKTSSKVNGVHIINGVEQLLEPIDGVLFLFSLIVREEASSKVSLPNLIEFIRMNLKEDLSAHSRFESMLYSSGYDDRHVLEYKNLLLRVRSEELYRVMEGFPRITPLSFHEGVPAGVGSINYSLNLEGASRWCVAKTPEKGELLLRDFLK